MAEEVDRSLVMRLRVIAFALTQLGQDDPSVYWQDVLGYVPAKTLSWCGAFVLWNLRSVFAIDWKWIPGMGFLYADNQGNRLKVPRLPLIGLPSIGDIAYFDKPFQHYALVESVDDEHRVKLVAGNTPTVERSTVELHKPSHYFSIATLL